MRVRLDTQMVALGLAGSREQAKRLILAGSVRVNGQLAGKPSDLLDATGAITVDAPEQFASRGGHKLEAALAAFHVPCPGTVCADLGASTGGFTDCLLQHSACRVHAVDVGKGQLAWKLRQDKRVIVHDKCNARHITPGDIGEPVDIVTIDVSFISLTKVLPAAAGLLRPGGWIVALVKPQFEAGKSFVKKGGVVRDSAVHERVQQEVIACGTGALGLRLVGQIPSPLLGPAGNKEFFVGFIRP